MLSTLSTSRYPGIATARSYQTHAARYSAPTICESNTTHCTTTSTQTIPSPPTNPLLTPFLRWDIAAQFPDQARSRDQSHLSHITSNKTPHPTNSSSCLHINHSTTRTSHLAGNSKTDPQSKSITATKSRISKCLAIPSSRPSPSPPSSKGHKL